MGQFATILVSNGISIGSHTIKRFPCKHQSCNPHELKYSKFLMSVPPMHKGTTHEVMKCMNVF